MHLIGFKKLVTHGDQSMEGYLLCEEGYIVKVGAGWPQGELHDDTPQASPSLSPVSIPPSVEGGLLLPRPLIQLPLFSSLLPPTILYPYHLLT